MTEGRSLDEVVALDAKRVSPATRIPFLPLVPVTAQGCEFTDQDGRTFLDLHSMACIVNTGHCHPRIVEAIQSQAAKLIHVNPGYGHHESLSELAEQLAKLSPGKFEKRVAFGLSGSDANDGALKLARAATGRPKAISFLRSYHGSTYGALSLSGVSLAMRKGFGPVVPDILHVPYPDIYRPISGAGVEEIVDFYIERIEDLFQTIAPPDEVAAVFLEPIQGDSGIIVPPSDYVKRLRELCSEHGILLIAEEVQTGMGRTGEWFASDHFDLEPDIVVVGKALGSGMPVSALVARSELMDHWSAPGHVLCTSGNPVCLAAALATIEVIKEEDLNARSRDMGLRFRSGFEDLARDFEFIGDIRGLGLQLGIDLVSDHSTKTRAKDIAAKTLVRCYELGMYLTFLGGNVLRICPPLIISEEQVDRALSIFRTAFEDVTAGRVSDDAAAAVTGW